MSAAQTHLDAYWMPFTANRDFKKKPRVISGASGHYYTTSDGLDALRYVLRSLDLRPRSLPPEDRRGGAETGRHPRLLHDLPGHQRQGRRAGGAGRQHGAGGHYEVFLHQFRFGVGRHRAEDRAGLSSRARRRQSHAADRPRARLSRRQLRRHVGRRHGAEPQGLQRQPDSGRRSHAAHARSRTQRVFTRSAGTGARTSPTISSGCVRCTTAATSPRSSSNRLPARPACCRRPSATSNACARSATSTASC